MGADAEQIDRLSIARERQNKHFHVPIELRGHHPLVGDQEGRACLYASHQAFENDGVCFRVEHGIEKLTREILTQPLDASGRVKAKAEAQGMVKDLNEGEIPQYVTQVEWIDIRSRRKSTCTSPSLPVPMKSLQRRRCRFHGKSR